MYCTIQLQAGVYWSWNGLNLHNNNIVFTITIRAAIPALPRVLATQAMPLYKMNSKFLHSGTFALSILNEDSSGQLYVKHYRILPNKDGKFFITEGLEFECLRSLISYYKGW